MRRAWWHQKAGGGVGTAYYNFINVYWLSALDNGLAEGQPLSSSCGPEGEKAMRSSIASSLRPIAFAPVIVAGLVIITGCSGDDASPSAARRPASTTTSTGSSVPSAGQSAAQLAASIGCADVHDRAGDPGEPVRPVGAVDCLLGESALGIQVYRTAQDRADVLRYLQQFAGFGVVGSDSIIEVDTPEAATEVARLTGGVFVDYSATTTTTT